MMVMRNCFSLAEPGIIYQCTLHAAGRTSVFSTLPETFSNLSESINLYKNGGGYEILNLFIELLRFLFEIKL